MDEYNICDKEDFALIASQLHNFGAVSFPYSADNITAFMVFLCDQYEKLGTPPYGGERQGKTAVGIMLKGFFHFNLREQKVSADYVSEKLNLSMEDGRVISELLNGVASFLL